MVVTFEELQQRIQGYYQRGDYQEVLALASANAGSFPEQAHRLAYWQAAAASLSGQPELAVQCLENQAASGFWYADALLRRSPALQNMQEYPAFEAYLQRNHQLQEAERRQLFPLLTLRAEGRCRQGGDPCPLLIGLHSELSTAQASLDFWRLAARSGWLTAAPQSFQALWKGAYTWNDYETTAAEIRKHYHALIEQYAVDRERVILAGRMLGGDMAIRLALEAAIPVQGFIAINPTGPLTGDLEKFSRELAEMFPPSLRGYIIAGSEDERTDSNLLADLADLLTSAGTTTGFEEIPDVGWEFSPEYEESLLRGLNFIVP